MHYCVPDVRRVRIKIKDMRSSTEATRGPGSAGSQSMVVRSRQITIQVTTVWIKQVQVGLFTVRYLKLTTSDQDPPSL